MPTVLYICIYRSDHLKNLRRKGDMFSVVIELWGESDQCGDKDFTLPFQHEPFLLSFGDFP
jgi:hypothetical protein